MRPSRLKGGSLSSLASFPRLSHHIAYMQTSNSREQREHDLRLNLIAIHFLGFAHRRSVVIKAHGGIFLIGYLIRKR